eukprot:TRINITY_DN7375_c1_g1_i1.p1 TRINITY_DN7375_c1_g1~~TRINITY_DN7375_c1_g1_i1.p1  ORF type:complete len:367 (+),score=54.43 TRINITY_DN7375_c1_g1_i1:76-1101(+)
MRAVWPSGFCSPPAPGTDGLPPPPQLGWPCALRPSEARRPALAQPQRNPRREGPAPTTPVDGPCRSHRAELSWAGEPLGLQCRQAPGNASVVVAAVEPGSPGERAGVAAGSILLEVGGRKISSTADVAHARHLAAATGTTELRLCTALSLPPSGPPPAFGHPEKCYTIAQAALPVPPPTVPARAGLGARLSQQLSIRGRGGMEWPLPQPEPSVELRVQPGEVRWDAQEGEWATRDDFLKRYGDDGEWHTACTEWRAAEARRRAEIVAQTQAVQPNLLQAIARMYDTQHGEDEKAEERDAWLYFMAGVPAPSAAAAAEARQRRAAAGVGGGRPRIGPRRKYP